MSAQNLAKDIDRKISFSAYSKKHALGMFSLDARHFARIRAGECFPRANALAKLESLKSFLEQKKEENLKEFGND